jgi:hypothetical protein
LGKYPTKSFAVSQLYWERCPRWPVKLCRTGITDDRVWDSKSQCHFNLVGLVVQGPCASPLWIYPYFQWEISFGRDQGPPFHLSGPLWHPTIRLKFVGATEKPPTAPKQRNSFQLKKKSVLHH